MAQSIIPQNQKKGSVSSFLTSDAVKNKVNSIIGDQKRGSKFISSLVSAVNQNPALASCEAGSLVNSALLGEALNLSPSPQLGHYYIVPFKDNSIGMTKATFQLGYKGYIQLAMRSGQYKKLNVLSIKSGELIKFDPLNEEIEVKLIEDDDIRETTDTVGYYAMFEYVNGFRKMMYWSKKKMEAHATKYSQGYRMDLKKGTSWTFWSKDFDGMAYKTMLRQLISKWGIMSIEMEKAYESDMGVIHDDNSVEYVDNAVELEVVPPEELEPKKDTKVEKHEEPKIIEQEVDDQPEFNF